jgi:hypothetical protein
MLHLKIFRIFFLFNWTRNSVSYTGCLKIRELRIQNGAGDHLSNPNMSIKKKSGLPPQRYIGLKVHSLNCVFFKYRLKSAVFIVIIYGVENNVKQFFEE